MTTDTAARLSGRNHDADVMRAAVVDAPGSPPRLAWVSAPRRTTGTTLLRVLAAPVNPLDLAIASGAFHSARHELPYTAGSECVGTVLESDRFTAGTLVYAECSASPATPGTLAEQVLVGDDSVVPAPVDLDPVLVAAVGNAGVAAYIPIVEQARLRAGQTVLALGATGAVGQIAVQLARAHGAGRVVGLGRDRPTLAKLLTLGADALVELRPDADEADLAAELLDAAGPVDVVLDGLYGLPLLAALRTCAPGARIVNIGNLAGPEVTLAAGLLRARQLTVTGFAGLHTPLHAKQAALTWLWSALATGDLRLAVRRFRLDDVTEAWTTQASSPHAKCVVVTDDDLDPTRVPSQPRRQP